MGAKTISWRKEPRAICGKPCLGGCADFFLPRESPQKCFRGQGSRIPDHSQILPTRAAHPGFLRRRDPSRSPRLALVPPVQSRKRNTPHARTPFCHASRPTVFQSFLRLSPAAPRIWRNEPQALRLERARQDRSRRRRLVRSCAANNAAPCPLHFRRMLRSFPRTPEAPRNPSTTQDQWEAKMRMVLPARGIRRAFLGWMKREKA